jgi:hypothetical protein
MYQAVIAHQFVKVLQNLTMFLDKAAAYADHKKFDMDVLLTARLAPDQFHFIKQVQIATDVAKLSAARLTGKEAPVFEDNEKTVAELKARIQKTVTFLQSLAERDFAGAAECVVTQPRWEGKTLTGAQYFTEWAVPNFYFHITTAYAILRHNGVDLGKKDFLGALPYKMP